MTAGVLLKTCTVLDPKEHLVPTLLLLLSDSISEKGLGDQPVGGGGSVAEHHEGLPLTTKGSEITPVAAAALEEAGAAVL